MSDPAAFPVIRRCGSARQGEQTAPIRAGEPGETRRTLSVTAALALCFGALTACGCDSEDHDNSAASPIKAVSRAEFVEKGNALCRANGEKIAAGFNAMGDPPRPAEFQAAYDTMRRESYKLVGDMHAVGAPIGQDKELVDLLVQLQQVTENAEVEGAEKDYADSSDPWADTVDKLVNDFGLTDCDTTAEGRARKNLDRHPNYILAAYMASGT